MNILESQILSKESSVLFAFRQSTDRFATMSFDSMRAILDDRSAGALAELSGVYKVSTAYIWVTF